NATMTGIELERRIDTGILSRSATRFVVNPLEPIEAQPRVPVADRRCVARGRANSTPRLSRAPGSAIGENVQAFARSARSRASGREDRNGQRCWKRRLR